MFFIALFTIAKKWDQPNFPPMNAWIKKMWYKYTMVFSHKEERNCAFAGKGMELEDIILTEITKHRKTRITYFLSYVET
jgi:hypothetical protein